MRFKLRFFGVAWPTVGFAWRDLRKSQIHRERIVLTAIKATRLQQGYNSATVHFVWLVRSPGTVYHCTFVRHLHYQRSKTCSRHMFFRSYFTDYNCFHSTSTRAANFVRCPCSDSSHVTARYQLSFYYYYYYYKPFATFRTSIVSFRRQKYYFVEPQRTAV